MASLCTPTGPSSWPGAVTNFAATNMPMYFFHGLDDSFPASNSQDWANQMNAAGVTPASVYVGIPGWGHNIWDLVYQYGYDIGTGQNVYQWLLSKSL
jgi:hypothetical protein